VLWGILISQAAPTQWAPDIALSALTLLSSFSRALSAALSAASAAAAPAPATAAALFTEREAHSPLPSAALTLPVPSASVTTGGGGGGGGRRVASRRAITRALEAPRGVCDALIAIVERSHSLALAPIPAPAPAPASASTSASPSASESSAQRLARDTLTLITPLLMHIPFSADQVRRCMHSPPHRCEARHILIGFYVLWVRRRV
jgi:hypothetical protein